MTTSKSAGNVAKLRRIISPMDPAYGVKGDDSTNDTAAWDLFMAALPGNIGIVPSDFWVRYTNSAIKTYTGLADFVLIFGENSGIKFTDNTKGGFNFDTCANMRFEDMQITYVTPPTGARVGTDQHAIQFQNCTGTLKLIRPRVLASPNMGIVTVMCDDVYLDHPYVYNTLADGIHTKDTPATMVSPITENTGDDAIATPRTISGALTTMPITIIGHRCINAGGRGYACTGATDVIYDAYDIDNTSQHGVLVIRDETNSLATPQRVYIGDGQIKNAGQYTYTPTTPTKGGHGIFISGGDGSNVVTIGDPYIYNSNGHGIAMNASASGAAGTVNLGSFIVNTTSLLNDASTPGRGVNVAQVGTLNLRGRGSCQNTYGAGFHTTRFNKLLGQLPDIESANAGSTTDGTSFIILSNVSGTGQAFLAGGNLIDIAGSPKSNTVSVQNTITGHACGFRVYRGDDGGLILSNTASVPASMRITQDLDFVRTKPTTTSCSNGGTTALGATRTLTINTNAATIATHTLTLPTVTDEGHLVEFSTVGEITALTVSHGSDTVRNPPTTLLAGGCFAMIYRKSATTWERYR